ncbi:hypothetical protein K2173_028590 [Erythroxylum novogranatense]|uniref:Histone-lysine N-methyltransferase ASHH2 n=1 Tax=Erythroxylum novogranatense TaxID=1862640 RepID=A0AAV8U2L3_9ROSI|nr:hypothetical protein K2173_028590 [Erythroxylum novogranatense]
MGSCENSVEVHEPLQPVATEQNCRSEVVRCLDSEALPCVDASCGIRDCSVDPTCMRDGCSESYRNGNVDCVEPSEGTAFVCVDDGSTAGSQTVVGLMEGIRLGEQCRVGGDCLNDESGLGTHHDNVETNNRLFVGNIGSSGKHERLDNCERLPACYDQQDEQLDGVNVIVQEGVEEKTDSATTMRTHDCDKTLLLPSLEMPVGCVLEKVSNKNDVEQDKQKENAPSVEMAEVDIGDKGFNRVHTDNHSQISSSQDRETLSVTCQPGASVLQDNQKDDAICGLSMRRIVVEKTSDSLAGEETAASYQFLACQDWKKFVGKLPMTGSVQKDIQQDGQEATKPVEYCLEEGCAKILKKVGSPLDKVENIPRDHMLSLSDITFPSLDTKSVDALVIKSGAGKESDAFVEHLCSNMSPHHYQIPVKLSNADDLNTNHDWQYNHNGGAVADCLSAKNNELHNAADICIKVLPLQPCQKIMEKSSVSDSLSDCVQMNEQRDNGSLDGPLTECTSEVMEEKTDVGIDTNNEACKPLIDIDKKTNSIEVGLPEVAPAYSAEKLLSSHSGRCFGHLEEETSNRLGTSHFYGKDVFGTIIPSCMVSCSREIEEEGKDKAIHFHSCETNCPDIGSSSSRKSNRVRRSGKKKCTAKRSRNKSKASELPFSNIARKKRTAFSKPVRSSTWGVLGNITQIFGLSDQQNHGSPKVRIRKGSKKHNNSKAGGSSRRSRGKPRASGNCIRLRVKVGKDVCQKNPCFFFADANDTSSFAEPHQKPTFNRPNLDGCYEDKLGDERSEKQLQCFDNKVEDTSYTAVIDAHLAHEDVDSTVVHEKLAGTSVQDYVVVPSLVEVGTQGAAIENMYRDPGTSPDSEVINLTPENQVSSDPVLTSKVFSLPENVTCGKKAKKRDGLSQASCHRKKDGLHGAANVNRAKPEKKLECQQKETEEFCSSEILISCISPNRSSNSSSDEHPQLPLSRDTEFGPSSEALMVDPTTEDNIVNSLANGKFSDSKSLLPSTKFVQRASRKSGGMRKRSSKMSGCARIRKENDSRQGGVDRKTVDKKKRSEKCDYDPKVKDDPESAGNHTEIGQIDIREDPACLHAAKFEVGLDSVIEQYSPNDNAWVRCDDCHKWRRIPFALVDSIGQTNCKWICKDNTDEAYADCSIAQEKSNAEINAELGLSDAEEDAYDFLSNDGRLESKHGTVSKEHEFTRISTNQFLHRKRRTQTIDEIMVCHCKIPVDGGLGCGDECLNRMLNIECVQGTCPCGDLCSNQQFQKQNYARMKWNRCGKKGFGLRLEEDISRGQFLIEYVGEVLDMRTYEARQKEYASKGHKHFYFMTLDGSEVIDACGKGNLGRFINHSCDPNCRTEKWVVNGEICIGLFALRDMKKGEEVTFDYNYVRVFGAAAKKCYCGSPQCRGYIGGDPTNTEFIDQVDSDEEFLEPVMLEDGEAESKISRISSFKGSLLQVSESVSKVQDDMDKFKLTSEKIEDGIEIKDSVKRSPAAVTQLSSSSILDEVKGSSSLSGQLVDLTNEGEDATDKATFAVQKDISMEEATNKTTCPIQTLEASPNQSSLEVTAANKKSKSIMSGEKRVFVKSRFLIRTSHQSNIVKRGKSTNNGPSMNKIQIMLEKSQSHSTKPRKLVEVTTNGQFEAVEEKLNELLDVDGGICKRKDAPKGYLKLLLLTAASGSTGSGEAIQSNRELSMILDALLKTKSKAVLMDVLNKNGLRMLHNMMKQYRRDFKKIPILRKLLKVLEYLAVREILTTEHISGGPPCPGMESFMESMLSLTEHNDKQVHQIARNFRDRWIPRHLRRFGYIDRDDGRMENHRGLNCSRIPSNNHWHDEGVKPVEASVAVAEAEANLTTAVHDDSLAPCVNGVIKMRKRKSRWDQPAEVNSASKFFQHDELRNDSVLLQKLEISKQVMGNADKESGEVNYCPHCVRNYSLQDENSGANVGRKNMHEDVPPGFSSLVTPNVVSSNDSSTCDLSQQNVCYSKCSGGGVVGYPQKKFISRLPVSYGIPLPIVQQFGLYQTEAVDSWVIAPGMPFFPFPPLPPLPHHTLPSSSCDVNSMETNEAAEGGKHENCNPAYAYLNDDSASTAGANHSDVDIPVANVQQTVKRAREPLYDLGRRYFKQQKWNKASVPPRVRKRNGWGSIANNSRGVICSSDIGSIANEQRNSYCLQDVSSRVEKDGNYFNQHSRAPI